MESLCLSICNHSFWRTIGLSKRVSLSSAHADRRRQTRFLSVRMHIQTSFCSCMISAGLLLSRSVFCSTLHTDSHTHVLLSFGHSHTNGLFVASSRFVGNMTSPVNNQGTGSSVAHQTITDLRRDRSETANGIGSRPTFLFCLFPTAVAVC